MSKPYNQETIAEINIIPFVDIILVILIIFMVTTPLLIKEGFSINLPKISSSKKIKPTPSNKKTLKISISNTGDIFVKGRLVSLNDLSFYTRKTLESSTNSNALIAADKSVSHGRVMQIIGLMKQAGVKNFTFSTQK